MDGTFLHEAASVRLGTEDYRLVRVGGEAPRQAWIKEYPDEPPYAAGKPEMVSGIIESWHLGAFKSQPVWDHVSEYGENTDARWARRLWPGPSYSTLTLTGSDGPPTVLFEAFGHLFVITSAPTGSDDAKAYRIDSGFAVTVSKDPLGSGPIEFNSGVRWDDNGEVGIVSGPEGSLGVINKVTAIGSPDSWFGPTGARAKYPQFIATGVDRLFGVGGTGILRNVPLGLTPFVEANWFDAVQCGLETTRPTGLVSYDNTPLVGKPEGLYGVSREGRGKPLISRINFNTDNFRGMRAIEPYVYLPTPFSTGRFVPGRVQSVGLENEIFNEVENFGLYMRDFDIHGNLIYAIVRSPITGGTTDLHLVVGREPRPGESSVAPLIWDTLLYIANADCRVCKVVTFNGIPYLFFGNGNNISYIQLPTSAPSTTSPPKATSGFRRTPKFDYGTHDNKDFPKIAMAGHNLSASKHWEASYSVDDGAFSSLDIDGNNMRITSEGRKVFFLPKTAVGAHIQYKLTCTASATNDSPRLDYFEHYAVPRSRKIPRIIANLHLATAMRDHGREVRGPQEQLADLYALSEQGAAVDLIGPWGDVDGWVERIRVVEVIQAGLEEPELLVEATLLQRETS